MVVTRAAVGETFFQCVVSRVWKRSWRELSRVLIRLLKIENDFNWKNAAVFWVGDGDIPI